MKLLLVILLFSANIFADDQLRIGEETVIDDLSSIPLRVQKEELYLTVHYPNYRMGGGTSPSRNIVDCLVLDIIDSDNEIDLSLKQRIADKLIVGQGFAQTVDEMREIKPEVKNNKIVFKTDGVIYYVTSFGVKTKDERNLKEVLDEIMPAARRGNAPSTINLLYVRDCRL